MAEGPSRGLADVVAASTALSDIDGRAGLLFYRGYDINDLAGRAPFEEVAFCFSAGSAPDRGELDGYRAELAAGRQLGAWRLTDLAGIARRQRPMEALRSLVSLGSADDPDAESNEPAANLRKAASLTAQQPVLIAAYHAARPAGSCRPLTLASASPLTSCCSSLATGRAAGCRDLRHLPGAARGPHHERLDLRREGMRGDAGRYALGRGRRPRHAPGRCTAGQTSRSCAAWRQSGSRRRSA